MAVLSKIISIVMIIPALFGIYINDKKDTN